MFELSVITTHQSFVEGLNSAGIEGVRAKYRPTMAYDTGVEHVLEIIVTAATAEGLRLTANWIVRYLKREPPREITINNQTINNAENVVMIVHNHIEAQNKDKG
jgi:hypothetical protein